MKVLHIRPFFMLFWSVILGFISSFVLIQVLSNYQCVGFLADILYCNPIFQFNQIASSTLFDRMIRENTYWKFLLLIITGGCSNCFTKLTNYHYSPIHRAVPDIISCVLYLLCFELVTFDQTIKQIGQIIGYIILFSGALTYNEFIAIILWT